MALVSRTEVTNISRAVGEGPLANTYITPYSSMATSSTVSSRIRINLPRQVKMRCIAEGPLSLIW